MGARGPLPLAASQRVASPKGGSVGVAGPLPLAASQRVASPAPSTVAARQSPFPAWRGRNWGRGGSRLSEPPGRKSPHKNRAMRRRGVLLILAVGLAALAGGAAFARPPVVVELYTAQGCSSCGKASAYVADLAGQKGVLPLTFAVDY